jgi:hypothetical protein
VTVLSIALLGLLAGAVFVSAAAKAVRPGQATTALAELGLPTRLARVAVVAGIVGEETVGCGLVLRPHARDSQLAYVGLFALFALLGLLALRRGRVIDCGCLGTLRRMTLGWPQIVQLAVVVPAVVVVAGSAPDWSLQRGFGVLFALQAAVAALLLASVLPVWWRIRRDRVSLAAARVMARQLGWTSVAGESEAMP